MYLPPDIYRVLAVLWCFAYQGGQNAGKEFGDLVNHRINAADDGSEWRSFLVDLGEPVNAWCGLSRVQTVIGGAVNDVFFLRFL